MCFIILLDVVRAYRGLIKEKEALEASLSALSPAGERETERESEREQEDDEEREGDRENEFRSEK